MAINGVGAAATAAVAVIIATTKFAEGAWISILLMLALMLLFALIRHHYERFEKAVEVEKEEALRYSIPTAAPAERLPVRERVVVPVDGVNKISLAAIALARELSSTVIAAHVTDDREEGERFRARWEEAVPDVPLLLIESPYRAFVAPMLAYVESLQSAEPDMGITVVLPSFVARHWWERLLHNRDVLRLKPLLRRRARVKVVDFPYRLAEEGAAQS